MNVHVSLSLCTMLNLNVHISLSLYTMLNLNLHMVGLRYQDEWLNVSQCTIWRVIENLHITTTCHNLPQPPSTALCSIPPVIFHHCNPSHHPDPARHHHSSPLTSLYQHISLPCRPNMDLQWTVCSPQETKSLHSPGGQQVSSNRLRTISLLALISQLRLVPLTGYGLS